MPARPANCPNCGADVARHAACCPACGADEKTGWSEEAETGHLGLPDESFDYEDYVRREFGTADPRPRGISWIWWLTAVLLLVIGLLWWVWR